MTKANPSEQKITPYLWFDNQAEEAAKFYTSIFENGAMGSVTHYSEASAEASGVPEGSVMTVAFQLEGQEFVGLNGGPAFDFTPAISFFVACDSEKEIDRLWDKLSDSGQVLMPLNDYPFGKFGWTNDRFGVSWQLNLAPSTQKISPFLLFVGDQHGRAEEAVNLYTSLFDNARIDQIERYGKGEGEPEGTVKHARFSLNGQTFMAMDSGLDHEFTFTEATSLLVDCEDQAEVDAFWARLSEGGEEGPCGWLKDKFGVSWQIVPAALQEMLADEDAERAEAVTRAMLTMKKIDIQALEEAYAR